MKSSYERWSLKRLNEKPPCKVDKVMSCIPLRGDPICRDCYERDMEKQAEENDNP